MTGNQTLGSKLIFLISQPRAGSTLLQHILAGHKEICSTAEPWFLLPVVYNLRWSGVQAEYRFPSARMALRDFLNNLSADEDIYLEAVRNFGLTLYNHALRNFGAERFLDKTPRYYLIIPELIRIFPEARFILLVRDPLDVLMSILITWVRLDWMVLPNFYLDFMLAPELLINGRGILGNQGCTVSYEEFVRQPESELKRLSKFLKIEPDLDSIEYGARPLLAGNYGDPTGIMRHQKPSEENIRRWQSHLHDAQYHHFLKSYLLQLGEATYTSLGYDFQESLAIIKASRPKHKKSIVNWNSVAHPPDQISSRTELKLILNASRRKLSPRYTLINLLRWGVRRFGK